MTNMAAFIDKWRGVGGKERQNYQLFLIDLSRALGVPEPAPANDDDRDNPYIFERDVTFQHARGETSIGRIDLYRRGAFVCEAKKIKASISKTAFDVALLNARNQAEGYARALSADEGRPPFLLVVDVGNTIELYSEFSRSGGNYVEFPDPRSYRIALDQLADPAIAERLRQVWLDPLSLDPSKRSAKVTREIAATLAKLAKSLEEAGHDAGSVAQFLMRCLFTMFSEDVGLLPKAAFTGLLEKLSAEPQKMPAALESLWEAMDTGGFSGLLFEKLPRFNGKLFKQRHAVPLNRDQIDLLLMAARADWRDVEPAIFGTLLERALNTEERHRLGAHYTPRAYVERLVMPTVIEPLRERWKDAQSAAVNLAQAGKLKEAAIEVKKFHFALTQVRVLDPACGTGNFLYVTLEHLKRLEGEVLNTLESFGQTEEMVGEGFGVDPHQLLGIEINPRAAAIAEVVLWIGYLQWHFRTRGDVRPSEPIVRDFGNIECRDAVLAYDDIELVRDENGKPSTRWDGKSFKTHPVTGRNVPDETRQIALERYVNPRPASWPEADYVVGNPPFLGKGERMRALLGDDYVECLMKCYANVPDSADLVLYWWDIAAQLLRDEKIQRFGFITTNSLRQSFNRRVLEHHMQGRAAISLAYAVPDHPWVDSADGAAVRIAMTVAQPGISSGLRQSISNERESGDGEIVVDVHSSQGLIHADLTIGANVVSAGKLRANEGITSMGVMLAGAGFIVTREQAAELGLGQVPGLENIIREYRNGRDLTQSPRDVMVIDCYGLDELALRTRFPTVCQHLVSHVKPERDQNRRDRLAKKWWIFAEARPLLRRFFAVSKRFVATTETSKHRMLQFLDTSVLPDHMLVSIGLECPAQLAVLSARSHVTWALAAGGTLENRPRYNKSTCFETFPFPALASPLLSSSESINPTLNEKLRRLGEQLDAHRKRQQQQHSGLTLTGMYNVLEKLKANEPLNEKEKMIHAQGLVSVLKSLHDEIDLTVLEAYGWHDLSALMQIVNGNVLSPDIARGDAVRELDEALLTRLVALNAERATEESRGLIRYLRPEFQHPSQAPAPLQSTLDVEADETEAPVSATTTREKITWPKTLPEQVRAVLDVLKTDGMQSRTDLGNRFKGVKTPKLAELLQTLVDVGRVRETDAGFAV